MTRPRCSVPGFGGAIFSIGWKEALSARFSTVKRYHYDSPDQLRQHLHDFIDADNFARRLKALGGLTPYEHGCKCWTSEPDGFIIDPIHQMPGPNT